MAAEAEIVPLRSQLWGMPTFARLCATSMPAGGEEARAGRIGGGAQRTPEGGWMPNSNSVRNIAAHPTAMVFILRLGTPVVAAGLGSRFGHVRGVLRRD